MTKTALITGITGQDGSYLAELLLEKGYRVCGMVRRSSTENFQRVEHLRDRIQLLQGDLLDQTSIASVLDQVRPDEVYNLAAMSFVPTSWQKPVLTAEFTAVGVTRVLDALRQVCPRARFYQASSSEMFGKVRETPQSEATPFHPQPLRRCQSLRPLHHGELPRELQPICVFGHSIQSRIAAPRPRVRYQKDHTRGGTHQARPGWGVAPGEPGSQARLGVCGGLRPSHVAHDAAALPGRLCHRHGRNPFRRRICPHRLRPRRT